MHIARTTGQVLKEARLKKGWTQVELAKKSGIHSNTIAKVERDEQKPTFDTVRKLSKLLNIDLDRLPE